jgi:hypothetical protein
MGGQVMPVIHRADDRIVIRAADVPHIAQAMTKVYRFSRDQQKYLIRDNGKRVTVQWLRKRISSFVICVNDEGLEVSPPAACVKLELEMWQAWITQFPTAPWDWDYAVYRGRRA